MQDISWKTTARKYMMHPRSPGLMHWMPQELTLDNLTAREHTRIPNLTKNATAGVLLGVLRNAVGGDDIRVIMDATDCVVKVWTRGSEGVGFVPKEGRSQYLGEAVALCLLAVWDNRRK